MPNPAPGRAPAGRPALRGLGVALAVACGAVAAWLIVTGKTQKHIEIGVLIGLWGALIGAYSMFSRRAMITDAPRAEVDIRAPGGPLEQAEQAAAVRREHELRLEEMLRRQIQTSIAGELAALRGEVAALRNDLLEKVGGQIRLERIETTRLIGSDIEALQQEVQQLKTARDGLDLGELVPRVAELVAGRVPDHVVERNYGPGPAYSTLGSTSADEITAVTAVTVRLPRLPR